MGDREREFNVMQRIRPRLNRNAMAALSACLCCVMLCAESRGAVVCPKNGEPIMGFLIHQDESSVKIEQVLPNGTRRVLEFLRSQIDYVLITVSRQRLEQLDVSEPEKYRDYAVELREKRQDPEARAAAIRLYVIAAYLDPENLGRSCLLGLIQLARNEQEERKFRAMAYLLDPKHDERILQRPSAVTAVPQAVTSDSSKYLLAAVRFLRQGKNAEARTLIERPDVQAALTGQFKGVFTVEELLRACAEKTLTPTTLSELVRLEMMLTPSSGAVLRPFAAPKSQSWRHGIQRDGFDPIPSFTLETLTEFDPQRSHYRNGKWSRPD